MLGTGPKPALLKMFPIYNLAKLTNDIKLIIVSKQIHEAYWNCDFPNAAKTLERWTCKVIFRWGNKLKPLFYAEINSSVKLAFERANLISNIC
jgi:hypothetical protein